MRKPLYIAILCAASLFISGKAAAQAEVAEQLGHLIDDALFYSDKYVSPATDAAVYQSASGWMTSPKERELWDVTLSVHVNTFFTPQNDRTFQINNSDFTFFQLQEGSSATVPTAIGNDYQVKLVGVLGEDDQIELATPEGVNMEVLAYPYFQGAVGVGFGTEVILKYSPKVQFRKRDFQVFGAGIKHNVSRYFAGLEEKNIHIAGLVAYYRENVSSTFLDINTDYGTLGLTRIDGNVNTWQFQVNGSKEFGKWEVMGGIIVNTSDIEYEVGGPRGTIEDIIKVQDVVNTRLKEIYKTQVSAIGEASLAYHLGRFTVQGIFSFGKFVNGNTSLQYSF